MEGTGWIGGSFRVERFFWGRGDGGEMEMEIACYITSYMEEANRIEFVFVFVLVFVFFYSAIPLPSLLSFTRTWFFTRYLGMYGKVVRLLARTFEFTN